MSDTNINYPYSNELRDVINESVKQNELLDFLRKKGMFYLNASHEDSSMLTVRLLLDWNDLNEIRHYAYKNANKDLHLNPNPFLISNPYIIRFGKRKPSRKTAID